MLDPHIPAPSELAPAVPMLDKPAVAALLKCSTRHLDRMRKDVERALRAGKISLKESREFLRFYESGMEGYTYLEE